MPALLADAEPGLSLAPTIADVLLIVAVVAVIAIAALSHEGRRPFSAGMVYLVVGLGGSLLLPWIGVSRLGLAEHPAVFEVVTDLTIAVAVFATGLRLRRAPPRRWRTLAALLVVTMPLTAGAVALFGTLLMGLPIGAAIVLGAALAPTDPVLAGDIGLAGPGESEEQTRARAAITAEAGANDGAAMPLLVLGLTISESSGSGDLLRWVTVDLLYAVAVSVALGAAIGWAASSAFVAARHHDFLEAGFEAWAAAATALVVFGAVELVGGYGFLGGFAAGLAFRRRDYESGINRAFHDGAGSIENVLTLVVIVLFGSALTTDGLALPGVTGWLLAPLLFLVVRPLAVGVALIGAGLPRHERLYVAWFGVKGVAAINYAVVALAAGAMAGEDADMVLWTTVACVVVSIVVHGITATALGQRWLDGN